MTSPAPPVPPLINAVKAPAPPVHHYENFPVASWLCPPRLRAPIRAIYHFARTADDVADEGDASPEQRLGLLQQFKAEWHLTVENKKRAAEPPQALSASASHIPQWQAVFDSLAASQAEWQWPLYLLDDLLDAFVQDVSWTAQQRTYANHAELLDYCARSANPVGRLLLHLCGVQDALSLRQSDAICSALQLLNFWQDLGQDLARGRHYVPDDALAWAQLSRADLLEQAQQKKASPALRHLIQLQVAAAVKLMQEGAPLAHRVPGRMGWELRAVVQGGLQIARRLEAGRFDTLAHRPKLGKADALAIFWRTIWPR